jgi:hypothetical protein
MKDVKATGEATDIKREHSEVQNIAHTLLILH